MTVRAVADTQEEAFAQALGRIPDHADVLEKTVVVAPDRKTIMSGKDFGDDVNRWNQWTIETMANQIVSELGKDQDRSVDSIFQW